MAATYGLNGTATAKVMINGQVLDVIMTSWTINAHRDYNTRISMEGVVVNVPATPAVVTKPKTPERRLIKRGT